MSVADLKFKMWLDGDQFDSNLKKLQKGFNRSIRKMERAGRKLTQSVTVPLGLMAGAAVKTAIDFEDAFAGVRKTVDATESQFDALRTGILDLSKKMPTAATTIAGVAEAAGQLGIKTDSILSFTETMVKLGDTTNMSADEAATAMARIANVMETPQENFDRMGSVVVDLGNNFATTESEITDFAQRISGAAKIAGMAESDVFSLGAAFSSVGVEAGMGGTAVQKVLIGINTAVAKGGSKMREFADVAGMGAREFKQLWEEDAGQGFAAFVNGLGKQGDQAAVTLEKLGLADQRLMRAFLSLANAGDLVNRTIKTGRDAWAENVALTEEAQKRYKTMASRIEMLKNRIIALGISIGDALMPAVDTAIDFVSNLTEAFENLSDKAKSRILLIAGLLGAAGPLIFAFTKIIKIMRTVAAVATSKFGLIVGAVALVITIGKNMVDNWEVIQKELANLWDGIKLLAIGLVKAISNAFASMWDSILGGMFALASRLAPALMEPIAAARGAINAVDDDINKTFDKTKEKFDESTKAAEEARKNIVDLGESFKGLVGSMMGFISGATGLDTMFEKVEEGANKASAAVAKYSNTLVRAVGAATIGGGGSKRGLSSMLADSSDLSTKALRGVFQATRDMLNSTAQAIVDRHDMQVEKMTAAQVNALNLVTELADNFTQSFGQGMANLIVQGGKLVDILSNIGRLLASQVIQKGISILLTGGLAGGGFFGKGGGLLGSLFGGGKAAGGPVSAGTSYIVGERGPEVFVPSRSGSIIPNNKLRGMGGGGSMRVSVPVYLDSRKIYEGQVNIQNVLGR